MQIKQMSHKVGAFAWYSVKIRVRVIFGVRFERRKVDIKKAHLDENWNMRILFLSLLNFKPNVIKSDPYNFERYSIKVGAFLRHSVLPVLLYASETWIVTKTVQEAQLPHRDSASATHVVLGSLADRALHWTPHLLYNYIIK